MIMISTSPNSPTPHSVRFTLVLLVAVFVLPFIVGTALFWSGWRTEKSGNYGELVQPVRPLPESGLQHADGRPLLTADLRGKWLLVFPVKESCRAACQQHLQRMLQVHIALNKEQSRLQRVFMVSGLAAAELAEVQNSFPDLVVAVVGDKAERVWFDTFFGHENEIFIVDPLGNLMMRYSNVNDMRGVLKDIERLLKYSWIR